MSNEPAEDRMDRVFRIGTRGSGLALAQTGQIAERLRVGGVRVEIEVITTRGDARGNLPVAALGVDGVFVRELERALHDGRIDIESAVGEGTSITVTLPHREEVSPTAAG